MNKYFTELQAAQSDELAPGLGGDLIRLALLAAGGITSADERIEISEELIRKGWRLQVKNWTKLTGVSWEIATRTQPA